MTHQDFPSRPEESYIKDSLKIPLLSTLRAASGKPLTVVIHSPTWIADHVCSDHLHFAYWCKARQEN